MCLRRRQRFLLEKQRCISAKHRQPIYTVANAYGLVHHVDLDAWCQGWNCIHGNLGCYGRNLSLHMEPCIRTATNGANPS